MNRLALQLAVLGFVFCHFASAVLAAEAGDQKIAIIDLDYVDTSGELRDQSQFHAHLVRGFSDALSRDLEASGKFHSVAIRCENSACTSRDAPSDLQKAAQAAGVRFVVFGGFHKMSTLVQWAKIEILDTTTGRIVFDRLVTFRNDTDEAWQRAEAFVVREIMSANIVTDQRGSNPLPVKLAVFDFELLDFSGGAGLVPESADDRAQLQKATEDVRHLLAQSGRYALVDVTGVSDAAAKTHELRKCEGCDAAIAKKLGADEAFLGIVTRITRTDYAVTYKLRDATGKVLDVEQSDLRIGANYSWNRGAVALVRDRLLSE